jgi:hypothetical protein
MLTPSILPEVQEVVHFLLAGNLFREQVNLDLPGVRFTGRMPEEGDEITHVESNGVASPPMTYHDILGNYGSAFYSKPETRALERVLSPIFFDEDRGLLLIGRCLREEHYGLVDRILDDLWMCALSRGTLNRARFFFDRLFKVYQLGGMPSGWAGTYPDDVTIIAAWPQYHIPSKPHQLSFEEWLKRRRER